MNKSQEASQCPRCRKRPALKGDFLCPQCRPGFDREKERLQKVLETAPTINVPVMAFDSLRRLAKASKTLRAKLKRSPTLEELAKKLNLSVDRVRRLKRMAP